MKKIELEFNEQLITVYFKKENVGTIRWSINQYHNRNYYLDIAFALLNFAEAKELFKEIAFKLKKPLQVMLSSAEKEKVAFLESAGFVCKRKCYETEAEKQDYIGQICEREIQYAYAGQDIYQQCCELMLDRYCLLHKAINPWTGSREDFFKELPDCVVYTCIGGEVSCFAFIEDAEIAYVYGRNISEFQLFAQALVTELFKKNEEITFESDDCDEMAMELKQLFKNQSEESYNTYVFEVPRVQYNEKYTTLTNDEMELKLIHFHQGNDVEIPYYWYEIIPKALNKPVGKISIRLGDNYHSYYNGHIGYEVDEEYRGHGYSYQAAKMVLPVAKAYGMKRIYLVCDEDNIASYKTIEKLGAELVELVVPPKDYFGWYEGIPVQRIYRLELD